MSINETSTFDAILFGGRRVQIFEDVHQTANANLQRDLPITHDPTHIVAKLLTLAGGDVSGLLSNSKLTRLVMVRNSTGNDAIRLLLMSNETKYK